MGSSGRSNNFTYLRVRSWFVGNARRARPRHRGRLRKVRAEFARDRLGPRAGFKDGHVRDLPVRVRIPRAEPSHAGADNNDLLRRDGRADDRQARQRESGDRNCALLEKLAAIDWHDCWFGHAISPSCGLVVCFVVFSWCAFAGELTGNQTTKSHEPGITKKDTERR